MTKEDVKNEMKAVVAMDEEAFMKPMIGEDEIRAAKETLLKYKRGKVNLENRVVVNEQWYKMRHWEQLRKTEQMGEIYPASAWLFNALANKHADAMDNYPAPAVLPRESGDEAVAKMLSSVIPVVLEQNEYEEVYSDKWWYKLKHGTGVEGVFWNPEKNGGLGDIEIRNVDILNLFWEPGVKDVQQSKHLFHVQMMDNDDIAAMWPQLQDNLSGKDFDVAKYLYDDMVDTSDKTIVVDWYYKKAGLLHYCKFAAGQVLYASENDEAYADRGFYDHGQYPFVFDPLYKEEGTPTGFGMVDVMKDPQTYIDKLNQAILKSALMASKKRFFIRTDGSVNEAEFADWSKDFVHVFGGSLGEDSIREIVTQPLPEIYVHILNQKIEELKETVGNRDFSQGGTTGGVTAASAIAALQEAGSKLGRDMIKAAYRAFTRLNALVVELIRQFYDEPRCFRILGEQGMQEFVTFDNAAMQPVAQNDFGIDMGMRKPVFDISVRSQKSSPFSKISQNELAKEFYSLGFFDPERAEQALLCMEMMDFDGKQQVVQQIKERAAAYEAQQQMAMQMQAGQSGQLNDPAASADPMVRAVGTVRQLHT